MRLMGWDFFQLKFPFFFHKASHNSLIIRSLEYGKMLSLIFIIAYTLLLLLYLWPRNSVRLMPL